MKTKHTKGPWNVVPNDPQIVATNIQKHPDWGYTWDEVCTLATVEAAALIAAAPEMLEVLEILVCHCPNPEFEAQVLSIIAKARGES